MFPADVLSIACMFAAIYLYIYLSFYLFYLSIYLSIFFCIFLYHVCLQLSSYLHIFILWGMSVSIIYLYLLLYYIYRMYVCSYIYLSFYVMIYQITYIYLSIYLSLLYMIVIWFICLGSGKLWLFSLRRSLVIFVFANYIHNI